MGIIDTLRAEGALVLLHDYRAGHCRDLSGNGNHGTPLSGPIWNRNGVGFSPLGARISVPDSAETRLASGSIVVLIDLVDTPPPSTYPRIVTKGNGVSENYTLFYTNTYIGMIDSTGTGRSHPCTYAGAKCVGCNFEDGERGEIFLDGVFSGLISIAQTFSPTASAIYVGASPTGSATAHRDIGAVLIFNRKLTATEHATVYAELAARRWPTQHTRRWSDWLGTGAAEGWGADYAIHETPNVAPGSFIGPWEVMSGAYKVEVQEVDGDPGVKVIECTNDGRIAMLHPEADDEFAHGTWDVWIYKGGTLTHPDLLIAAATKEGPASVTQYTYMLTLGSLENVILKKYIANVGTTLAASDTHYITETGWVHLKLTRSAGNVFTVYVNGALLDVTGGSGTNPVTDAAVTDGKYLVCDFKIGDRIAWAGVNRPFFAKSKGVI